MHWFFFSLPDSITNLVDGWNAVGSKQTSHCNQKYCPVSANAAIFRFDVRSHQLGDWGEEGAAVGAGRSGFPTKGTM